MVPRKQSSYGWRTQTECVGVVRHVRQRWEWCQDNYHESYAGAPTDGSAWVFDRKSQPSEHDRRMRGRSRIVFRPWRIKQPRGPPCHARGGYASYATSVSSSHRAKASPYERNRHYGVRLVMAAEMN